MIEFILLVILAIYFHLLSTQLNEILMFYFKFQFAHQHLRASMPKLCKLN